MMEFFTKIEPSILILIVFLTTGIFYSLGVFFNNYLIKKGKRSTTDGLGILEGAVLALLSFFISFCFSISGNRLENRRKSITEESNAISTALLRVNLYIFYPLCMCN